MDPEYDDSVSREFAALKPRERALLWLAYVEGESHQAIADALGLSRGSIKYVVPRSRPAAGSVDRQRCHSEGMMIRECEGAKCEGAK